jgi:hypothetical protein
MKRITSVLFFLIACGHADADDLPIFGYCDGCVTSGQWQSAAENASFDAFPMYLGRHDVYVVDRTGERIRAFNVIRWTQNTGTIPRSSGQGKSTRTSRGYHHAEGIPMDADPVIAGALLDALDVAKDFRDVFGSGLVPIEELGLFGQIPSAIDLVGPANSDAGVNRMALRNELEVYVNQAINSMALQLYDLAQMALMRFLSDSSVTWFGGFVITFPDGTSIRVNLDEMRHIPGAGDFAWAIEVEILEYTVMGGGLSSVPSHPGHFSNFMYQGDINVIGALIRLAERHGIPVTGPGGSSGGGNQTMACEISGDLIVCDVVGSR